MPRVAFDGLCCNVATITCSTWSRVIEGGRPGRSSSTNPSSRRVTNRFRHLVTVVGCTRRSAAICLFDTPSAHAGTILQRCARACDHFDRRDRRTN
jgi:hypothetical protein